MSFSKEPSPGVRAASTLAGKPHVQQSTLFRLLLAHVSFFFFYDHGISCSLADLVRNSTLDDQSSSSTFVSPFRHVTVFSCDSSSSFPELVTSAVATLLTVQVPFFLLPFFLRASGRHVRFHLSAPSSRFSPSSVNSVDLALHVRRTCDFFLPSSPFSYQLVPLLSFFVPSLRLFFSYPPIWFVFSSS